MISFVYFDVGGVIIDDMAGSDRWDDLKRKMGIAQKDFREMDEFYLAQDETLCSGTDIESIVPQVEKRFGIKVPEGYSLFQELLRRFNPNPLMWPLVGNVKKHCPVGLLTNMFPGMFAAVTAHHLLPPVQWDAVVDSSVEKVTKPEKRIYEIATGRTKVAKENILFIDNTKQNIDGAAAFGWQTYWYDSRDHKKSCELLEEYFEKLGLG